MKARLKDCPRCHGELAWKEKVGIRASVSRAAITLRAQARCLSCERTFSGIRTIPVMPAELISRCGTVTVRDVVIA